MTTLAAQRVNCICIPRPCASVVISADMLRVRGCVILSYLFFLENPGPEIGPSAGVPFWCQRGPNFCPPRQSKMIWRGPKNGPRENQKWALVRGPFLGPWFFQKRSLLQAHGCATCQVISFNDNPRSTKGELHLHSRPMCFCCNFSRRVTCAWLHYSVIFDFFWKTRGLKLGLLQGFRFDAKEGPIFAPRANQKWCGGAPKMDPERIKSGPSWGAHFWALGFFKKVIVASAWLCDCIPGPCASVVISADMLRVRGCIILSYLNFLENPGAWNWAFCRGSVLMPKRAQFLPPAPIKNDLEGPQKWTPRESKVGPREGPIFGPLVFSKKVIVASAWLCDMSSYIPSMTTVAAQRVNWFLLPMVLRRVLPLNLLF